MVYHLAKLLKVPEQLWDDCIGEGFVTLCICTKHFDPDKGVKFSTYAYISIKRKMVNIINQKYPKYRNLVQLEESDHDKLITERKTEIDIPWHALSDREKEIIIDYYWNGLNHAEIGKKQGVTPQMIQIVRNRALGRLFNVLQEAKENGKDRPRS